MRSALHHDSEEVVADARAVGDAGAAVAARSARRRSFSQRERAPETVRLTIDEAVQLAAAQPAGTRIASKRARRRALGARPWPIPDLAL